MAYDIGTARGVVQIAYDGKGVTEAQAGLSAVEAQSGKGAAALTGVGKAATKTGLVIAAGLGAAVYAAANFEQKMSNIGAVSGATAKEMEGLRAKALQLGKDTQFSASESADAIEELIKAGISVKDVINGAADATVNLAAAGGVDMPTAASVMSAAMNTFGVAGKDVAQVADLIAGAANASATDVVGVGEAFKYVAPLASAAGISIEDTTVAIAALAKQGIEGSMAGTTLRGMLQNLTPMTDAAAAKMEALGIITKDGSNQFYDAAGNTKSMAEISGVLQKALKGLNDEQMTQALTTMFGARAMTGAVALAKAGKDGFEELATAVGKVSAADVAAEKMDNLKGSFEELKGSVETLAIEIGTPLLNSIRGMVDGLTGAVNWFLGLSNGMQKLIGVGGATAAGILLVVGALIKIIVWGQKVNAMLALTKMAFLGTWAAALGPILAVVAAVAAVVAIFVLLYKKNETFRNAVNAAWAGIKAAVAAVVSWFQGTVAPAFAKVFNAIKEPLMALWAFFKQVWSDLTIIVTRAWSIMGPAVMAGINLIKSVVVAGFNILKSVVVASMNVIKAVFTTAWRVLAAVVGPIWNVIKSVVKNSINVVKNVILGVLNVLKGDWKGAWNNLKAVAQSIWNIIKAVITNALNAIKGVFVAVLNGIKSVVTSAFNGIKSIITSVINGIKSIITSGLNAAKAVFVAVWNAVKAATTAAWNGIKSAVTTGINNVMNLIRSLPGKIKGALSGAASWLVSTGADIVRGLISGISSMAGAVMDALLSLIPGPLKKFAGKLGIGSPSKVFKQFGKWVGQGFIEGVVGTQADVTSAFGGLVEKLKKKGFNSLAAMAKNTRSQLMGIAKTYEEQTARLQEATDKLREIQEEARELRREVAAGIVGTGDIASFSGKTDSEGNPLPVTFADIIAGLRGSVQQARAFAQVITQLQNMGLNQTALEQLIDAGPEAGLAAANAILAEGAGAVAAINDLQIKLQNQADYLGQFAADNMYDAGIKAAQGLVNGLESQIGALEDTMEKLARALVKAIRRALRVKSPSRVMRELGKDTGLGFVLGLAGMARDVSRAGTTLADAARFSMPPGFANASGGVVPNRAMANAPSGPGANLLDVKVFIGETELTDIVRVQVGDTMAPLRRVVQQGAY